MRRFSILGFAVLLFSFCKKSGGEGGGAGSGDSAAAAYQTSAQIGAAGQ